MELRRSKRLKALLGTTSRQEGAHNTVRMQVFSCPEIIENIVEYLNLRGQKNCRLVCKTWNQEVSRMFRNNLVAVTISRTCENKCKLVHSIYSCTTSHGRALSDLRKTMKTGEKLKLPSPFKDLKLRLRTEYSNVVLEQLKGSDFELPVSSATAIEFGPYMFLSHISLRDIRQHGDAAVALISACGSHLTHLSVPSLGVDSEILSAPLELPELKCLTVFFKGYTVREEYSADINNQGHFFPKLVASAPKLETLEIEGVGSISRFGQSPSTPYLSDFLSVADLTKIQELSISVRQEHELELDKILTSLKTMKIDQLRCLRIFCSNDLRANRFNIAILWEVIAQFSHSLQELSIQLPDQDLPFIVPACPKLTNLRLGYIPYRNLDLSSLPNLKKIRMMGSLIEPPHPELFPILSVELVSLDGPLSYYSGGISEGDLIKIIFDWFPSVKKWEVGCGLRSAVEEHIQTGKLQNQIVLEPSMYAWC